MDWANLIVRWVHFTAGIAWIGSSFYFIWLDRNLTVPTPARPGVEGDLWMVHSGGFYQVEKRRIGPGLGPAILHWFKWEAMLTWASGIVLLAIVYYAGSLAMLVEPGPGSPSRWQAIALSVVVLVGGWILYDAIWRRMRSREWHALGLSSILLIVVIVLLFGLLSPRAAYMHVGALMGTVMVANVWLVILPAQHQMIDATMRGETPDWSLGAAAKRRSVHNSYLTFPVLFLMVSSHYPQTWGHPHGAWLLVLLSAAGALARHAMIGQGPRRLWALAPMLACLVATIAIAAPRTVGSAARGAAPMPRFADVRTIIHARCLSCHSAYPTDRVFTVAPLGVVFDTPDQVVAQATRIRERAVVQRTMPFGNGTGMTDAERELLGRWIDAGAPRP